MSLAAIAAVLFVSASCNKGSNDPVTPDPAPEKFTCKIMGQVTITEDLQEMFNFTGNFTCPSYSNDFGKAMKYSIGWQYDSSHEDTPCTASLNFSILFK